MTPSLFLSHGAPTLALEQTATTHAWRELAKELPTPKAILVISAHWDTKAPMVSTTDVPRTIHDFGGFPRELYELKYPAPGAAALAQHAAMLLAGEGIECGTDSNRGLDHGAWVPLLWMYPDAKIPVTQLSVQSHLGAAHHTKLGRALAPLRGDGVLILGSGGIVHNLRELDWHGKAAEPFEWARNFNDWMAMRILTGATAELDDYRKRAPEPVRSHPTEEHLVPLFVAMGAGGAARRIELGFDLGSLGMDGYLFG